MKTSTVQHYDAVVIGAGSTGDPLARALADAGKRTALIEKDALGGTCANRGCTPTKAYEASGRIAHMARIGGGWGVRVAEVQVDLAQVRARKDQIVAGTRTDTRRDINASENLDLLEGKAHFIGPREVLVQLKDGGETPLSAETFVISTGTRPMVPPLDGLDQVPYHTSDTIYETDELPDRLLVLGGNYIGVEASQIFQRFGVEVTLVEMAPHLLPQEDEDVARAVQQMLENDGLKVVSGCRAVRVSGDAGDIRLHLEDGRILQGSHLLVATGRTPNTEKLNLEAAGVKLDDRGYIIADEGLRTSVPGIYAGGDVARSEQFTHIAYDDFRVLRSQLLGDGSRTRAGRAVPYIVYTDPPLGRVGLSETQAKHQAVPYKLAQLPMTQVAYAVDVGETVGFIKVLLCPQTEQILGVAVFGLHAEEVMSTLQVAQMARISASVLRDTIFAYPTVADAFARLFANNTAGGIASTVSPATLQG